eukprot:gene16361-13498_t
MLQTLALLLPVLCNLVSGISGAKCREYYDFGKKDPSGK